MESLREINNLETYVGCNWRFVLIRDSLKCFNQVHFVSHIISISMNDYFQFETHRESFKSSHFERRAASFSSQNLEKLTENSPFERSRSMRRLNAGIFRIFELSEWTQTNFPGTEYWKSILKLLRRRLGRSTSPGKLLTWTRRCATKLGGKYGFEWKTDQKSKFRGLKLRGFRQNHIKTSFWVTFAEISNFLRNFNQIWYE